MWRAIRYGLDGELLDLETRERVSGRATRSSGCSPGPRRCGASWASRSALPERNGAQRQRACSSRASLQRGVRRDRGRDAATYARALDAAAEVIVMSTPETGSRPRRSCAPPTRRRSSRSGSSTCCSRTWSRMVNLGMRRTGLVPGTEDERDLTRCGWRSSRSGRCCRCSRAARPSRSARSATPCPSCRSRSSDRWPRPLRPGPAGGPAAGEPASAPPPAAEPAASEQDELSR